MGESTVAMCEIRGRRPSVPWRLGGPVGAQPTEREATESERSGMQHQLRSELGSSLELPGQVYIGS